MPDLLLALFAGMLTIAAPCTLPVLPILLGASIGRRAGARPAFIAVGFVVSFAFVALALNAVATALHFDPDALRLAGLVLLVVFGALMIWPAAFERLAARLTGPGVALHSITAAPTNLGGFVLGTTLGLIWTPCAGPMLAVAYGGQAISTRLRRVAPYTARLQQAFGNIVIAFALSAFLQYDAVALGWLGQFFPEGRLGL